MGKKIIKLNLWDMIDLDRINAILDKKVSKSCYDITYITKKIDKKLNITLEADYLLD